MTSFVTISDLIMNGGDGRTLLRRQPSADHLTIVSDDNNAAHLGSVMISHGNANALIWRTMRGSIMDSQLGLTVGDLNDARGILLRDRMCSGCCHFQNGRCWNGCDNWKNFKEGICPDKK
jgi:hypothetical protein